jgi:hypothetical protein
MRVEFGCSGQLSGTGQTTFRARGALEIRVGDFARTEILLALSGGFLEQTPFRDTKSHHVLIMPSSWSDS